MTIEKIRVGIIGAGANTCQNHIPRLQNIDGVEILEVANRSTASAQRVADKFQIPTVRSHWQDVATSENIDAVLIGTWPYLHCEATCLALKSGKHVLCEARMAMDEAEARKMLKTSYDHPNSVAQLVPSPFTLRADQTILEFLDQNMLGEPLHFQFNFHSSALTPPGDFLHWRRNKKYSGTNIMVLGIIYESLLRWFGPAKSVNAQARFITKRALDPDSGSEAEIQIPDFLSVQMEMRNGMLGSLSMSEYDLHADPPHMKIFGKSGVLYYEFKVDGKLFYGSENDSEMKEVSISSEKEGRWRVEEEFVQAIRGQEEIEYTTFTTGVEYMKFTEAVNHSFRNAGEATTIPMG